MARINYDPFPYAQPDDFVHREIVGRDYTIRAVVEDPEGCMLVESSFIYQGHAFEITKVTESPSAIGTCLIEIVGFERMMQPEDRLEWLAKVREMFGISAKRRKLPTLRCFESSYRGLLLKEVHHALAKGVRSRGVKLGPTEHVRSYRHQYHHQFISVGHLSRT